MSFSRIKYDSKAYDLKLNRSIAPGDYRLFKGFNENCSKCYSFDGPKNAKSDVNLSSNLENDIEWAKMADVESRLTNRVNKLVDDNQYGKNDKYLELALPQLKPHCNKALISEDTRFTTPIEAYRSMDTTAYHYVPFLFTNPQCEIQQDRIGLNSRLTVKDKYQASINTPIDETPILPSSLNPDPKSEQFYLKTNQVETNINNNEISNIYNMCKNR